MSTTELAVRTGLDEEIRKLVNLGEKDPLTIARKLEKRHGKKWIDAELSLLAEDIVAGRARGFVGDDRRGRELALHPGNAMASAEMQLASFWVPSRDGSMGWKRAADLTAEDLLLRAGWYERFAVGVLRRAQWCRDVAGLIVAHGVGTVGELPVELPPLPDEADLVGLPAPVEVSS